MGQDMVIDEKLINYLEDLSFITLSSEERVRICRDLENILAGMELLSKLNTDSAAEQGLSIKHKTNLFVTNLRKDEVRPSFPRDEILKNAPEAKGGTFVVPKTVE